MSVIACKKQQQFLLQNNIISHSCDKMFFKNTMIL